MLESTTAAETARQAALAAQSGLPLAAGLRAAADDAPSRRVAAALRRLANEVERGAKLETLLAPGAKSPARLPPQLAGLLVAAQRTGDLPTALLQWLHDRRQVQTCWRELAGSLAYPLLLLAVSYAFFLFNSWALLAPFRVLFEEWQIKLPVNTRAMLAVAEYGPALSLALLCAVALAVLLLRVAGGPVRYWQTVHALPLAGNLFWWTGAADCFRGLALLTARGVPLPEALALTGPTLGDAAIAAGCRQLQQRVEQGSRLSAAMRAGGELPVSTAPLVHAGEAQGDLPGALLAAAQLLENRVREQALLATQVVPPLLLACTLGMLVASIFALFMPMINLIQLLTQVPPAAASDWLCACAKFRVRAALARSRLMGDEPLGLLNFGLLLAPACILLAVQRLGYRRNESGSVLQAVGGIMLLLGLAGPLIALFGWASIVVAPIVAALALMSVDRIRNAEHRALLDLLAVAAERGAPLTEAAHSYAAENPGDTGFRALIFAETLERGAPAADAARRAKLRLSTGARLALALAEQGGSLAAALRGQAAGLGELDGLSRLISGRIYYALIYCAMWLIAMAVINLRVLAMSARILTDFGLDTPNETETLLGFWRRFGMDGTIAVQFLLFGLLGVAMLLAFFAFVGWLWRDFPFVRRWFWQYDAAVVLRALAGRLRSGQTLPDSLALCAEHYPRGSVRRRLVRAEQAVAQGRPWMDALQAAGLIGRREAGVLSAAQRVGNTSWALEEVADGLLRRLVYRTTMLVQFMTPLVVLTFGAITGFYAVAVFLPLFALIQGLS